MSEQWVVNASPLILLARIGREDYLYNCDQSEAAQLERPRCDPGSPAKD
jgi:hypothetical protein